jgi:hypothetical protein
MPIRSYPEFWSRGVWNLTNQAAPFCRLLSQKFINVRLPGGITDRDVVEEITRQAGIPLSSLSDDLAQAVYPYAQAVFSFAGEALDKVAHNYLDMHWWVSDKGLEMVNIVPYENALALERSSKKKRGRPVTIPQVAKARALAAKQNGATGKAIAQILYNTPYPTAQQVKNQFTILSYYKNSLRPSTVVKTSD